MLEFIFSSLLNEWGPTLIDKKKLKDDEIEKKTYFIIILNKIKSNQKNRDQIWHIKNFN
jgi:hypothetical protein